MESSNKTIVKNTMFLYMRMLFNMTVSLYSSRVVLKVLGIEDFGIYSLVAGVIVLFSFLNSSLTAATQRYINVEKVTKNIEKVRKIFNISLLNHFLISILAILFAETVGVWFLNSKLNIPIDRIFAANIVFQLSAVIMVFDIMRVPFNSLIIAYERMSFYAWLGIFETVVKLLVISILLLLPQDVDRLIFYSLSLVMVGFIVFGVYYFYCRKNFGEEIRFKVYKDFSKIKELLNFSGWMLFGQLAAVGSSQGLNMIINLFYGVVLNAAVGIANQVDAAVYSFVSNFQIAFNPQIVQTYANGEFNRNKMLVLSTSKFSFFLMAILSLPVLYFTHSLLAIWLGDNLPIYVESLVKVVIFCSLINAMSSSFWMSAAAIGASKVKEYNIALTMLNIFTLPIAYLLMRWGYNPIYAFIAKLLVSILMQLFRWYFIDRYLNFDRKEFTMYLVSIIIISIFLVGLTWFSKDDRLPVAEIIWQTFVFESLLLILIYTVGLRRKEKDIILRLLKDKIFNKLNN